MTEAPLDPGTDRTFGSAGRRDRSPGGSRIIGGRAGREDAGFSRFWVRG